METAKDGMMLAARQKKGMAREARIITNVVRGVERISKNGVEED